MHLHLFLRVLEITQIPSHSNLWILSYRDWASTRDVCRITSISLQVFFIAIIILSLNPEALIIIRMYLELFITICIMLYESVHECVPQPTNQPIIIILNFFQEIVYLKDWVHTTEMYIISKDSSPSMILEPLFDLSL